MKPQNTQIWLFCFADLAFLLLIAFTQTSTIGKKPVSIGEMTIPKVVDGPNVSSLDQVALSYQVRIHRPSTPKVPPFQIVVMKGKVEKSKTERLAAHELSENLRSLREKGAQRPILVPDEYSLSKDMLLAMSLIEKVWSNANRVTVKRVTDVEKTIN